jgi:hypothetical protein
MVIAHRIPCNEDRKSLASTSSVDYSIPPTAESNPRQSSVLDLLLLSDRACEHFRSRKWLTEIDFNGATCVGGHRDL